RTQHRSYSTGILRERISCTETKPSSGVSKPRSHMPKAVSLFSGSSSVRSHVQLWNGVKILTTGMGSAGFSLLVWRRFSWVWEKNWVGVIALGAGIDQDAGQRESPALRLRFWPAPAVGCGLGGGCR